MAFATWDRILHHVDEKRISWVYRNDIRAKQESFVGVLVKSTEPASRRWLVTQPFWNEEKAVGWCISVDPRAGETIDVYLNPHNLLSLILN
jgi:hypothetical protein